jgi:hypothetical protein
MKALCFAAFVLVGLTIAIVPGASRADSTSVDTVSAPAPDRADQIDPPSCANVADDTEAITLSKDSVKACRDRCFQEGMRCIKANGKDCSGKKIRCYQACK